MTRLRLGVFPAGLPSGQGDDVKLTARCEFLYATVPVSGGFSNESHLRIRHGDLACSAGHCDARRCAASFGRPLLLCPGGMRSVRCGPGPGPLRPVRCGPGPGCLRPCASCCEAAPCCCKRHCHKHCCCCVSCCAAPAACAPWRLRPRLLAPCAAAPAPCAAWRLAAAKRPRAAAASGTATSTAAALAAAPRLAAPLRRPASLRCGSAPAARASPPRPPALLALRPRLLRPCASCCEAAPCCCKRHCHKHCCCCSSCCAGLLRRSRGLRSLASSSGSLPPAPAPCARALRPRPPALLR